MDDDYFWIDFKDSPYAIGRCGFRVSTDADLTIETRSGTTGSDALYRTRSATKPDRWRVALRRGVIRGVLCCSC